MIEGEQPQPPRRKGFQAILRIVLYLLGVGFVMIVVALLMSPLFLLTMPRIDLRAGIQISLATLAILYLPLAAAIVVFTRYFVIYVDNRPFETFGLSLEKGWTSQMRLGVGLGIGMPALMFVASYLAGWTKITGSIMTQPPSHILAVLVQSIIAMGGIAVVEETVMRGYVLQTLKWGYEPITAVVASSILFGSMHLFNPNATFQGFLGTTAAGLFLAYCYLVTKKLWLPIGVHLGWNFALGPIFGFPVSGIDIPSWIVQRTSGPSIWTGGAFGPEAGLMTLVVLLLGALVVRLTAPHRPLTMGP